MENNNMFLNDLIEKSLSQIKELSSSSTIVGEAIVFGENTIIPISKVSIGFVTGGGTSDTKHKRKVSNIYGGSGGGVTILPVGFVLYNNFEFKFIDCKSNNASTQALLLLLEKMYADYMVKKEQ